MSSTFSCASVMRIVLAFYWQTSGTSQVMILCTWLTDLSILFLKKKVSCSSINYHWVLFTWSASIPEVHYFRAHVSRGIHVLWNWYVWIILTLVIIICCFACLSDYDKEYFPVLGQNLCVTDLICYVNMVSYTFV